jgi:hypothetical protein
MTTEPALSPDEQEALQNQLPWYVAGTLAEHERDWVDDLLRRSAVARNELAREQALVRATNAMVAESPSAAGLEQLLARVRERRTEPVQRVVRPPGSTAMAGFFGALLKPRYAMTLIALVVAQSAVVGWLLSDRATSGGGEVRAPEVTELRTLRVTFVPNASEAKVRAALMDAGAHIVGGPNQMGEYWIASSMRSLDEVKVRLLGSKTTSTIEVDLLGPRGQ